MTHPSDDSRRLRELESSGPVRWLAEPLDAQRTRFGEALDRVSGTPDDPEAIHDLRVASRRLTGILGAARPWLAGMPTRKITRGLRDLRRSLNPAREAEVGLELLAELRDKLADEARGAAAALAARLVERRNAFRQDAPDRIRLRRAWRLHERIGILVDRLRRAPRPEIAVAAEASAIPAEGAAHPVSPIAEFRRAVLTHLHERWDIVRAMPREPLDRMDDVAQHELRIAAKKLRYALELFSPALPRAVDSRLLLLKTVQDRLGRLHDFADLRKEAVSVGAAAREAGFTREAIGFDALALELEQQRARGYDGFPAHHAALVHPAFLPPQRRSEAPEPPDFRLVSGGTPDEPA